MQRLIAKAMAVLMVATFSTAAYGEKLDKAAKPVTPDQTMQSLLTGNKLYVLNNLNQLRDRSRPRVRRSLATTQKPVAVIVSCSDSRVPPEIIFDRGLGELFTIRVAGNVVAPHELGSIEYALEHLGTPLIVVLGHERCGAVTAAVDFIPGTTVPPNIMSLIDSILPAVNTVRATNPPPEDLVEECVLENIRQVAAKLLVDSTVIAEKVAAGTVKIVKARYDLDTGLVTLLP